MDSFKSEVLEIYINKIHCVNCVNNIKSKIKKYENQIDFFDIDLNSSKLFISLKNQEILDNIKKDIESLGYKLEIPPKDSIFGISKKIEKKESIEKQSIFFDKEFIFVLFINLLSFLVFVISMFFHNLLLSSKVVLLIVFFVSSFVYFVGGYRFLRNSFFAIKNKTLNMDVLISLSTTSAYFYSVYNLFNDIHIYYFESLCVIIGVILLGKYIENKLKTKKIGSITNLLRYKPKKVLLFKNNEIKEINIQSLKEGDIIELKNGDFVPVNGVIIEGQALIDLNFIYGEFNRIELKVNDEVHAGALVVNGNIKLKAIESYEQSFWNSLEYLIKNISNKESSYLNFVDKIAGNFVIIVFSLAIVSLIIWKFIFNNNEMAFKSFISTLIIACPCAIGLAYPLAVNKGIIQAIKKNILVKDISAFEKIVKSKIFVFDKTGTITSNNIIIKDIIYKGVSDNKDIENNNFNDFNNYFNDFEVNNTFVNQALFIATYKSNHVLSKCINYFIKAKYGFSLYKLLKNHKIIDFKEVVSKGIFAKVNFNYSVNIEYQVYIGSKDFVFEFLKKFFDTEKVEEEFKSISNSDCLSIYFVLFFKFGKGNLFYIGVINYQEEIRSEVFELINYLRDNKKEIYILTGGAKDSAIYLAKNLNISLNNVFYEVNSVKKYDILLNLKKKGSVVFVGDGINDSIVIKEADVGISFEYGNDLTQNLADAILKDISYLKDLYLISLKTFNKLRFNLFWVFFYNILLIPLAMGVFYNMGIFINPMLASISMSLSSISLLIFNLF
jgi:heavy metal translocating P-type ATPase